MLILYLLKTNKWSEVTVTSHSLPEYWSGWPFPSPGDLPDPGIKLRSTCIARQMLYQLSHKGSPRVLEWVAFLFSSGSSQPRDLTGVSLIAGGFFTNWAIREAPDYTDWCVNHFSRMYCKQKTSSAIYRIRLSVYKGSLPHHRRI